MPFSFSRPGVITASKTANILTPEAENDTRAHASCWECVGCGHRWRAARPPPSYCRHCGTSNGYAPVEIALRGSRSDELDDLEPGPLIAEWSVGFPNGIPVGRTLVVRGRMGAGKSRAVFRLASQYESCAILGLEMGKKLSRETARNAGANTDSCIWYDDVEDVLADLEILIPTAIAIDSIQKLGRCRNRVIRTLRRWVAEHDATLFLISQLSKDGRSRYGEDDDFDCDVMLDCLPGTIEGVRQTHSHGINGTKLPCDPGCCHIAIRKSRISPLIGFDVPIIAEIPIK